MGRSPRARLPVSPPSLRPAPTLSPRHLSPHLSLASRPAVWASAGAFPPPGSRHLTCGCSPRPPAEPRARQPSRPRATRRGGSSHGALRMQTPRHARLLPRVRTVPAMGHGRRSSLSRSHEQISAHETRIYEQSVAEWLSRCSGVVRAPKASGSKSLPEAPEGHSGWSQADCGVSRAGCSASAASPRGPPSLWALLGSHHTLPGGRDQAGLWDYTWEQVCRRKVHPDDGLLGIGPVGDVA